MMENELLKRQIPDFFKGIDSKEKWEENREKIKELFLREEYGFLPKRLTPTIEIQPQGITFAGKASWESVFFTFENNGKKHTIRTELILPKKNKNVPVFLFIDFEARVPSKYFPVEEILDGGFGALTFCYESVTTDNNDFTNGLCGLFLDENEKCNCGKISVWAYMASLCMDYLETRNEVGKVAIVGHSRLGKTALLASALDERFILTCVNESGCSGASLSRGKNDKNESIKNITEVFPFWFCDSYLKYVDNEKNLPFDQHMLLALVAPRYVMVGGAIKDVWADNEGAFLSCHLASKIWRLYGKNGFVAENTLPCVNESLLDGDICFHLRDGEHFMSRYDWNVYMKKFKQIMEESK